MLFFCLRKKRVIRRIIIIRLISPQTLHSFKLVWDREEKRGGAGGDRHGVWVIGVTS